MEGKNLLKKQWDAWYALVFKRLSSIVNSYRILVHSIAQESPRQAAWVSREAHLQLVPKSFDQDYLGAQIIEASYSLLFCYTG